jgi:hypothetical protein
MEAMVDTLFATAGGNQHRSEALSTCRTKLTSDRLGPGAEKVRSGNLAPKGSTRKGVPKLSRPQQPTTNSSTMQIALRKMGLCLRSLRFLYPKALKYLVSFWTLLQKSGIRHEEQGHH